MRWPPRSSSQNRLKFVPSKTSVGCPWSRPARGTANAIVAGFGGSKRALSVRPKRIWRSVAPKRSSTHATIQRFEPNACAGSVWFGVWVAITNGVPSATVRPSRLVSPDAASDHATIGVAAAPPNVPSPAASGGDQLRRVRRDCRCSRSCAAAGRPRTTSRWRATASRRAPARRRRPSPGPPRSRSSRRRARRPRSRPACRGRRRRWSRGRGSPPTPRATRCRSTRPRAIPADRSARPARRR